MINVFIPAAKVQTELPFLDLGDETRVPGDGKFFGVLDGSTMLNETDQPSFLPFPIGNDTNMRIFVSTHLIKSEIILATMLLRFQVMDSSVLVLHIIVIPYQNHFLYLKELLLHTGQTLISVRKD